MVAGKSSPDFKAYCALNLNIPSCSQPYGLLVVSRMNYHTQIEQSPLVLVKTSLISPWRRVKNGGHALERLSW